MLTLYDFGNSVCCQKVRITLCAKRLDWEPIKVDLFKTEQYDPKYLKLNPKGVVPTLVHDLKSPKPIVANPPFKVPFDLDRVRDRSWCFFTNKSNAFKADQHRLVVAKRQRHGSAPRLPSLADDRLPPSGRPAEE